MKTNIVDMTNEEILRQQLELLAKRSKTCEPYCLAEITRGMCEIYSILESSDFNLV